MGACEDVWLAPEDSGRSRLTNSRPRRAAPRELLKDWLMQTSESLVRAYRDHYEKRFRQSITADEAERQLSISAEIIRSMTDGRKK